jgi:hypothetical protein
VNSDLLHVRSRGASVKNLVRKNQRGNDRGVRIRADQKGAASHRATKVSAERARKGVEKNDHQENERKAAVSVAVGDVEGEVAGDADAMNETASEVATIRSETTARSNGRSANSITSVPKRAKNVPTDKYNKSNRSVRIDRIGPHAPSGRNGQRDRSAVRAETSARSDPPDSGRKSLIA